MPRVTAPLSCSICLNDDSHNDHPWTCLIPCGHIFHIPCVREWTTPSKTPGERRRKPNNTCPACRGKILRPAGSTNGKTKEISRFTKIVFGGDVQASLTSSSPVRPGQLAAERAGTTAGAAAGKRALYVIRDSDDDASASEIEGAIDELSDIEAIDPPPLRRAGGEGEGGLTESESDGENARPARAVYAGPGRRAAHHDGAGLAVPEDTTPGAESSSAADAQAPVASTSRNTLRDARELRESRTTISTQRERIEELEHKNEQMIAEATAARRECDLAREQIQSKDRQLQAREEEMAEFQQRLKDVTSERSKLNKSLKIEVDKNRSLTTSNQKAMSDLTTQKIECENAKAELASLTVAYDKDQDRLVQLEARVATYSKTHEILETANKNYCRLLAEKKVALKTARADLAAFRDPAEIRKMAKSKMKEFKDLELDDAALEKFVVEDMSDDETIQQEHFAQPKKRQTSGASNGNSRIRTGTPAVPAWKQQDEFDESLIVEDEQVPDSQGDGDRGRPISLDDDDSYGDMDAIMGGGAGRPSKKRYTSASAEAVVAQHASIFASRSASSSRSKTPLVRDPLREQTNSPGRKASSSRSITQASSSKTAAAEAATSTAAAGGSKKRPLSALNSASASAKWADMALMPKAGTSKKSGSVFVGEKKKAKTFF